MDEANRLALAKAFELSARAQQPWGTDAILKAAEEFRGFLETETTTEPVWARLEAQEAAILALEREVAALHLAIRDGVEPKRTRQRSAPASSTTGTTPPDLPDVTVGDIPTPVDF